jgi:hypothetical protein
MKVITVINDENNPVFNLLRLSCALYGLKLVALISNKTDFYSRRLKDDLLKDYLLDEHDDEIILFTDGIDAIFTTTEEEILTKFSKFNSDLVFSAETGCWPDNSLAKSFILDEKTPYNYLNSGGFIGKIGLIKELLNDNDFDLENYSWSNQYLWSKRYLKNAEKIKLDRYCEIFCTLFTSIGEEFYNNDIEESYRFKKNWFDNNIIIEKNRIFNKITNTWPCHAHFNGSSKMFLDDKIFHMVYSAIPGYKKAELYFEK